MQSNKNDFSKLESFLPPIVHKLAIDILNAGGRCVIVGGWIRDRLLQVSMDENADIDIDVFGISYEKLCSICQNYQPIALYPHFGILRLKNIDLSLPRTEILLGKKYNDFRVKLDPYLTFPQAASRRDFSVNAIGWDFLTNEVFDSFDGINAIKQKYLFPLTEHFKEDSYRVLRAAQLIARFNFKPSKLLITLARQMDSSVISKQHIQLTKAVFQKANYKKAATDFLRKVGAKWEKLLS